MNEHRLRKLDRGHDSGEVWGPDEEWIRRYDSEEFRPKRMRLWVWILMGIAIAGLVWGMSLTTSWDPGLPSCTHTTVAGNAEHTRCG